MNADQLPGKAADILKQIRKNYKVKFETLAVQDKELQILQVTDIEPLLAGKDPFKNTDDFPFWVKLWEASMMLAHTIGSLPPKPGSTLLELGAGLAAPGLVAAALDYKVTLSDYEPIILDFQRVSAAASGLKGVEFKILDWKNPPKMEPFDTIIGAEILFREEFFEP
ncbi:MAG: protein N-lysine methyltransferase family protein, partial [Desulfobulbaceae bacterium]|nr:protein N-lysine methyltransferase family protein [Desulfobulbaceae bacterium]